MEVLLKDEEVDEFLFEDVFIRCCFDPLEPDTIPNIFLDSSWSSLGLKAGNILAR